MNWGKMFDSKFIAIVNLHISRCKVLKEAKDFENAVKELELIIAMMVKAITTTLDKKENNIIENKPLMLQGVKNVTLQDVLDSKNTITIDKVGFLRIRKT